MAFDKQIVLAVNTRFSCLSVIDGYFNFTPIWQPPFVTDFTGDDRCHLNGMAFHDGKVRLHHRARHDQHGPAAGARGWRKAAS